MDQTIKQLEEMLKVRKEQKEIIECAGGTCVNCNPDIQALQNAISRLKKIEEVFEFVEAVIDYENDWRDSMGTDLTKLSKEELINHIHILENNIDVDTRRIEELEKNNERQHELLTNIWDNSIPKSVIRDKIEEYLEYDKKHKRYTCNGRECFTFAYFKAEALKEILGDE